MENRHDSYAQKSGGYWKIVLKLKPGTYKFKYFGDNKWHVDYCAFGIEYGPHGQDSIVKVPAEKCPLCKR